MLIAKQIAEKFDGVVIGDENREFNFFSSIKDHDIPEGSLSYITDKRYYKVLESTLASIVIIPIEKDLEVLDLLKKSKSTLVMVKNPVFVFVSILRDWYNSSKKHRVGIAKTSIIASDVVIGKDVYIGDNVVIESGSQIGDGCEIYSNTFIGENVKIGKKNLIYSNVSIMKDVEIKDNVIIHSGVTIGSDGFGFLFNETFHMKVPQIGSVRIGNDVEIGANTTIDRSTLGDTIIGDGTKIDNLVQIAHNVEIGKHCIICSQVGIAGSTIIGDYVTLAGQAGITGHITIGNAATVAAQAGVTKSVKPNEIVSGYPAMTHKDANHIYVLNRKLPEMYETIKYLQNELKNLKNKLKDKNI